MTAEVNDHQRLFSYVGLLLISLIILVYGIIGLPGNWPTVLLGAGLTAFAGFEVRHFYVRISYENKSIRANQSGSNNTQTLQTNPKNSPVIARARDVYVGHPGVTPQGETPHSPTIRRVEPDQAEWLVNGEVRFQDYEEFVAKLNTGDQLRGSIVSEDSISIEIMDDDNFEAFEEDQDGDNYDVLWRSPKTTNFGISYVATARRNVHLVIIDEVEEDYDEDEEASATARIRIVRKSHEP